MSAAMTLFIFNTLQTKVTYAYTNFDGKCKQHLLHHILYLQQDFREAIIKRFNLRNCNGKETFN